MESRNEKPPTIATSSSKRDQPTRYNSVSYKGPHDENKSGLGVLILGHKKMVFAPQDASAAADDGQGQSGTNSKIKIRYTSIAKQRSSKLNRAHHSLKVICIDDQIHQFYMASRKDLEAIIEDIANCRGKHTDSQAHTKQKKSRDSKVTPLSPASDESKEPLLPSAVPPPPLVSRTWTKTDTAELLPVSEHPPPPPPLCDATTDTSRMHDIKEKTSSALPLQHTRIGEVARSPLLVTRPTGGEAESNVPGLKKAPPDISNEVELPVLKSQAPPNGDKGAVLEGTKLAPPPPPPPPSSPSKKKSKKAKNHKKRAGKKEKKDDTTLDREIGAPGVRSTTTTTTTTTPAAAAAVAAVAATSATAPEPANVYVAREINLLGNHHSDSALAYPTSPVISSSKGLSRSDHRDRRLKAKLRAEQQQHHHTQVTAHARVGSFSMDSEDPDMTLKKKQHHRRMVSSDSILQQQQQQQQQHPTQVTAHARVGSFSIDSEDPDMTLKKKQHHRRRVSSDGIFKLHPSAVDTFSSATSTSTATPGAKKQRRSSMPIERPPLLTTGTLTPAPVPVPEPEQLASDNNLAAPLAARSEESASSTPLLDDVNRLTTMKRKLSKTKKKSRRSMSVARMSPEPLVVMSASTPHYGIPNKRRTFPNDKSSHEKPLPHQRVVADKSQKRAKRNLFVDDLLFFDDELTNGEEEKTELPAPGAYVDYNPPAGLDLDVQSLGSFLSEDLESPLLAGDKPESNENENTNIDAGSINSNQNENQGILVEATLVLEDSGQEDDEFHDVEMHQATTDDIVEAQKVSLSDQLQGRKIQCFLFCLVVFIVGVVVVAQVVMDRYDPGEEDGPTAAPTTLGPIVMPGNPTVSPTKSPPTAIQMPAITANSTLTPGNPTVSPTKSPPTAIPMPTITANSTLTPGNPAVSPTKSPPTAIPITANSTPNTLMPTPNIFDHGNSTKTSAPTQVPLRFLKPTSNPTITLSEAPSFAPSSFPSSTPSKTPTTAVPTSLAPVTFAPTTLAPSNYSFPSTLSPTTLTPTTLTPSTSVPSSWPSKMPSISPSTVQPTIMPTALPTSMAPTPLPTSMAPTPLPTPSPVTIAPTLQPTTAMPTSMAPTPLPTASPVTASPTMKPSFQPTTARPTFLPTASPVTAAPTMKPTLQPTTARPNSVAPIPLPTALPVGNTTGNATKVNDCSLMGSPCISGVCALSVSREHSMQCCRGGTFHCSPVAAFYTGCRLGNDYCLLENGEECGNWLSEQSANCLSGICAFACYGCENHVCCSNTAAYDSIRDYCL